MGPGRFELPTSPASAVCSPGLNYGPRNKVNLFISIVIYIPLGVSGVKTYSTAASIKIFFLLFSLLVFQLIFQFF